MAPFIYSWLVLVVVGLWVVDTMDSKRDINILGE